MDRNFACSLRKDIFYSVSECVADSHRLVWQLELLKRISRMQILMK